MDFFFTSPSIGAGNNFGARVEQAYGNSMFYEFDDGQFAIVNGYDDTNGANAGAVFFYDTTGVLIRTVYGGSAGDWYGCAGSDLSDNCDYSGVYGFEDSIVIASPFYDGSNGALTDSGRVCSYTSSGVENWCREGDDANDNFGGKRRNRAFKWQSCDCISV